jgi:hypothetical protein
MSNLTRTRTGLPFVVWISPGIDPLDQVRLKVSPRLRATISDFVTVVISPDVHVIDGEMSIHDLALLREWVELNREVIVSHWNGDIEYSEDAIAAIKPISLR